MGEVAEEVEEAPLVVGESLGAVQLRIAVQVDAQPAGRALAASGPARLLSDPSVHHERQIVDGAAAEVVHAAAVAGEAEVVVDHDDVDVRADETVLVPGEFEVPSQVLGAVPLQALQTSKSFT